MILFILILTSTLSNGFFVENIYSQFCGQSCRINNRWVKHTVCERALLNCRAAKSCGWTKRPFMNDEFRQAILDKHNELRNKIALAQDTPGPQPAAANMNALNYNFELEFIAQCLANTCKMKHDKCRRGKTLQVGQNLAMQSHTSEETVIEVETIIKSVQSWYNEVEIFSESDIDKFTGKISGTGHYTQMVWADIEYIGCGRIISVSNGWYTMYLVCNYGGKKTGGNLQGVSIYKKGAACSDCPANKPCNKNYTGLCGNIIPLSQVDRGAYGTSSRLKCLPIFHTIIKHKNVSVFLITTLWYVFMKILL